MFRNRHLHTPPVILALETATACGSVAMVTADRCLGEYSLQSDLTHSRRLLPAIATLMAETHIGWEDVDAVAVSSGPGSFTGLRIGMSTAKGLVMAAGKALVSVPTLDGLASQFAFADPLICPVLDARKKEVYAAFFRCTEMGIVRRQSDYMALAPEDLAAMIGEETIFVGDGILTCCEMIKKLGDLALIPPAVLHFPRAAAIGMLAVAKWKQGELLEPAAAVPLYVRASDAEINFPGQFQPGRRHFAEQRQR
jgi:tRNA threonylcarbamoyladenosine biosynthesis protein TsaB